MNIERGCKRITILASCIIGIWVWLCAYFTFTHDAKYQRYEYTQKEHRYNGIKAFWEMWDTDTFTVPKEQVEATLLNRTQITLDTNKEIYTLDTAEVYPDLENAEPNEAKEKAINQADFERIIAKTFWARQSVENRIILCSGIGIFFASLAITAIWLAFFILRWAIKGFISPPATTG